MKTLLSANEPLTLPSDPDRAAWEWVNLLTSGAATDGDAERFQQWVRADSRNRAAYLALKSQWDTVRSVAEMWRHSDPAIRSIPSGADRPLRTRRMFMGAAGALAASAAVVTLAPFRLWPQPSEWGADYRTATGEQRTIAMASRVQVTLNTQTSIRRDVSAGNAAGVELVSGELAVDLAQAERFFTVTAGAGRSTAENGQFEVRNLDGKVCVTCIEGSVRVMHPAGEHVLSSREQAVYDDVAISGKASIDPASVSAWRNGMLVLHDMRLADAIDEINRYRAGRVILMNNAAGERRVNGNFPLASLDQTVTQLQSVFGLQARALGNLLILT